MLAGRVVVVPSLDSLPAEAAVDRDHMLHLGIQSNLTLPLSVGGRSPVGRWASTRCGQNAIGRTRR